MTNSPRIPIYQSSLYQFLWHLRDALSMTQKDVGTHMGLHHSRIARYENSLTTDKPHIGYVAELACLISEYNHNDPEIQETILAEINKAVPQLQCGRLRSWEDLRHTAQSYMEKQNAKRKNKRAGKDNTRINAENTDITNSKSQLLHELNLTYATSQDSKSIAYRQLASNDKVWQMTQLGQVDTQTSIKLFGIAPHIQRLHHLIIESDTSYIISIEGLGGLGKTTIADHIVRSSVIEKHFQGVAWINAKQQEFLEKVDVQRGERVSLDVGTLVDVLLECFGLTSALALEPRQKRNVLEKQIRDASYLIVIDNLETEEDIEALLPYLQKLANPSKILLTSRYNLQAYPDVAHIYLNQLSFADALHLLRHEALVRGPSLLADASNAQLKRIYQVVGGNPLALKLVVGQIDALSLPEVIEALTQIQDNEVDELYTRIYQKSWLLLDKEKQLLLLMMPLIYNSTVEQLLALTQLKRSVLNQAIRQLVRLSLIEAGGELHTRRYQLHRLTETFLLKKTIQWRNLDAKDVQDQTQLFRSGILRNLSYWQDWLAENQTDLDALDEEREGILKAIRFGLDVKSAWLEVYLLIETFATYMERRGFWDEWGEILQKAIELASQYEDIKALANLSAVYARLCLRQSYYQKSVKYYFRSLQLSRQVNDFYNEARACSNLGYIFIERGKWHRARVLCNHALEIFERLNHSSGIAHTKNHLGVLLMKQKDWDNAIHHFKNACIIWEDIGNNSGLVFGYNNLGKLLNEMEVDGITQPLNPMDYFDKALILASQVGDEVAIGVIYLNMGIHYRLKSYLSKAEEYTCKAEKIFRKANDLYTLAGVWDNLGLIFVEQKNYNQGFKYLKDSLNLWQELGDLYSETRTMIYLARSEYHRGDLEKVNIWLKKIEILFSHNEQSISYEWHKKQLAELYDLCQMNH